IYLMFGLNETGWQDYSLFVEQYDKLIKEIKQLKPDINIYVFLLYTCYKTTALSHEVIKDNIASDNELLKQMCIDNKVLYLDLNQVLLAEDGYIKDELTNDGIHLNDQGAKIMEDYIDTHVYRKEKYVKEACN
ncbi:MAG: SGNH/GDSL hydrolase family protein, partial [Firmicutes bacterium]|nr:SGNH/GDSL hydrolase family protein [Bacillota bacterium]